MTQQVTLENSTKKAKMAHEK